MPLTWRAAVTTIALAGLAAAAWAAPPDLTAPRGPAFGSNRYTTRIESVGGAPDGDDYVSALLPGEKLSVSVAAGRNSALEPVVELIGPDGTQELPPLKVSRDHRAVSFKSFRIGTAGRWTVRISGANSTQGEYTVAFQL